MSEVTPLYTEWWQSFKQHLSNHANQHDNLASNLNQAASNFDATDTKTEQFVNDASGDVGNRSSTPLANIQAPTLGNTPTGSSVNSGSSNGTPATNIQAPNLGSTPTGSGVGNGPSSGTPATNIQAPNLGNTSAGSSIGSSGSGTPASGIQTPNLGNVPTGSSTSSGSSNGTPATNIQAPTPGNTSTGSHVGGSGSTMPATNLHTPSELTQPGSPAGHNLLPGGTHIGNIATPGGTNILGNVAALGGVGTLGGGIALGGAAVLGGARSGTSMFPMVGGGQREPNLAEWENMSLEDVERLRQELLQRNDIGRVLSSLEQLGIHEDRSIIEAVKRYNFDSAGLAFTKANYNAWNRLAQGKGIVDDARYLVHEITEVKALQKTGFDFMGTKVAQMTNNQRISWFTDFDRYYREAHSEALHSEYQFLANQVNSVISNVQTVIPGTEGRNPQYSQPRERQYNQMVIAAVDPTRSEGRDFMEMEGVPLHEHHEFGNWLRRQDDRVYIRSSAQQRLSLPPVEQLRYLISDIKRLPISMYK